MSPDVFTGSAYDGRETMHRRYADERWREQPPVVVVQSPRPGQGEVAVDRQLIDPDRPELGWEWCALWLHPPGTPPGFVADGDVATRASSASGSRDAVLAGLAELPAGRCLVRAGLVQGLRATPGFRFPR